MTGSGVVQSLMEEVSALNIDWVSVEVTAAEGLFPKDSAAFPAV